MKYERLTILEGPFDIAFDDCEVHTHEIWNDVTEAELHELHEEYMEADINTPKYQKAEFEQESGFVWEDTPVDFEEFKAQMIADGLLRVKEETA